jgi:hypothetical protein
MTLPANDGREVHMSMPKSQSLEDRLRAVEDKLAIYQLIASLPPTPALTAITATPL